MNKQLLITLFATAFSGIIFAEEVDYTVLPDPVVIEYCTAQNTEVCQKIAILWKAVTPLLEENALKTGVAFLPEEQDTEMRALQLALYTEIEQHNASKLNILEPVQQPSILDDSDQKAEEAGKEIAKELNITDSKE